MLLRAALNGFSCAMKHVVLCWATFLFCLFRQRFVVFTGQIFGFSSCAKNFTGLLTQHGLERFSNFDGIKAHLSSSFIVFLMSIDVRLFILSLFSNSKMAAVYIVNCFKLKRLCPLHFCLFVFYV